ncbi:MAG: hypothetical protein QM704_12965 [Anaeromyxobacteraceae bacterium]
MAPLPIAPQGAKPGWQRAVEIGLRSAHIAAMGLVLGGIAMGGTHDTLLVPICVTVSSGVLLLATSLTWGCMTLGQGSGLAILLKLALLGLGNLFPGGRLGWYLAATAVTSVGSHMPSAWRHWSPSALLGRRVIRS